MKSARFALKKIQRGTNARRDSHWHWPHSPISVGVYFASLARFYAAFGRNMNHRSVTFLVFVLLFAGSRRQNRTTTHLEEEESLFFRTNLQWWWMCRRFIRSIVRAHGLKAGLEINWLQFIPLTIRCTICFVQQIYLFWYGARAVNMSVNATAAQGVSGENKFYSFSISKDASIYTK